MNAFLASARANPTGLAISTLVAALSLWLAVASFGHDWGGFVAGLLLFVLICPGLPDVAVWAYKKAVPNGRPS